MKIGILALQGAFLEHEHMLQRLETDYFEIRQKKDLKRQMDGFIIPGGESTVMRKLLKELDMFEILRDRILSGLPVFGTCAGLILLAKEVEDNPTCFGSMNIRVKRNAYGRQLGSFYTQHEFAGIGIIPMSFIRAPYIAEAYEGVQILAWADGKIVAARQGNQLVTAFHPEVNEDVRVHQYFLDMICRHGGEKE